jgi:hypothetical protein
VDRDEVLALLQHRLADRYVDWRAAGGDPGVGLAAEYRAEQEQAYRSPSDVPLPQGGIYWIATGYIVL